MKIVADDRPRRVVVILHAIIIREVMDGRN